MNYLLLVVGVILVAITAKSAFRELLTTEEAVQLPMYVAEASKDEDYLEYLQKINGKLEVLNQTIEDLSTNLNESNGTVVLKETDFARVLQQTQLLQQTEPAPVVPLTLNDKIYQGHLEGKGITELAKEFGKGKGEIELILNLRR